MTRIEALKAWLLANAGVVSVGVGEIPPESELPGAAVVYAGEEPGQGLSATERGEAYEVYLVAPSMGASPEEQLAGAAALGRALRLASVGAARVSPTGAWVHLKAEQTAGETPANVTSWRVVLYVEGG